MKLDRRHLVLAALLVGLPLAQALGNRDRASRCRLTAQCPVETAPALES